ncbi:Uncharacterized protein TCM_032404 [Theobroma cacao]|uniref:Uncharacterized protein n=1 Tax=Theobroma cacao TaxID=3641 RepID=A0A061FA48_THECC|nr:Uncharacterized protein TCM_032404 [Theobroma cacao]
MVSEYGYHGIPAVSHKENISLAVVQSHKKKRPVMVKSLVIRGNQKAKKSLIISQNNTFRNKNPKPEGKPGYDMKPEGEEKLNYETKQYNYKPKPEEKEKLLSVGVEGLYLCESGPKYILSSSRGLSRGNMSSCW